MAGGVELSGKQGLLRYPEGVWLRELKSGDDDHIILNET